MYSLTAVMRMWFNEDRYPRGFGYGFLSAVVVKVTLSKYQKKTKQFDSLK